MNASVYLQNQGWRGIGHSLDPSDRGLSKPLLVPHKSSKAGLGSKEHDFGNQWWLNAWDGLSDSSPNRSNQQHKPKPPECKPLYPFARYPSLHSCFVKAESLWGTIFDHNSISQSLTERPKPALASVDDLDIVNAERSSDHAVKSSHIASIGPSEKPSKRKRKHSVGNEKPIEQGRKRPKSNQESPKTKKTKKKEKKEKDKKERKSNPCETDGANEAGEEAVKDPETERKSKKKVKDSIKRTDSS